MAAPQTNAMTLANLFPDEDYRFQMRFERAAPSDFFAPTPDAEKILVERKHWLRNDSETCAALLPQGESLLNETVECARHWNGFSSPRSGDSTAREQLLALGEFWEADFLLVKPDADNEIRLYGGCLCFPSSWRLSDKLGKPIEFIHKPVAGLNAAIGPAIHKFLAGIKPGIAWLRHNWGLSRSPELNQHPDRSLPRLDANVALAEVWLRVEHQALISLPKSGGILFGIHLKNYPLTDVRRDVEACSRFSRALETMPEEMASYKGIAKVRARLLELLRA